MTSSYKGIARLVAWPDMVSHIFAEYRLNLLSDTQFFLITATHQYIPETNPLFSESEVSHSLAFESPLLFICSKRGGEISKECIFSRTENAVD
jgi:hypothetical protein